VIAFQDKGDLFISMDANFGLVRKSSAGNSQFEPRSDSRLFTPQAVIDDFVKNDKQKASVNKVHLTY